MKSHINHNLSEGNEGSFMVHTNIVEPVPYEMEELEQIRYGLKLAKQAKEKALSEAKDGEDREMLEYDLENIQAAKERTEKY